jgi:ribosomal protein S18 acetylase RimI-like enzyme
MLIVDWRELTAEQVAPLYADQGRAWADSLGWDLSASWAVVERARLAGALPGLACLSPRGAITGWTFFMRQNDVVQIGALSGRGAQSVREILEAILDSPEAAGARELTCLVYPARPNVLSALTRRRFALQPLRYFSRVVGDVPGPDTLPAELVVRRWRDEDAVGCVRVLARAYGRDQSGRSLAPNGTLEEWAHYLGQVLRTPACGTLLPRASVVVEEQATGAIAGFLLATTVGLQTAHVAQLAVDPQWVRRGVGRTMLRTSLQGAATGGIGRMTLLVSGDNDRALPLYASEGFRETGQLVFASRLMPVRRQVHRRAA